MIATITASQVTIGAQNDNGFRVIGTTGTLEWSITDHTVLKHYAAGQPVRVYRQGAEYGYFPGSVKPYLRLPSGHPEGFHEALANLHRTLEWTIRSGRGETVPKPFPHPGIADGVAGMAFIEAAVASSKQDGEWVEVPKVELSPGGRSRPACLSTAEENAPMKDPMVRFSVAIGGELLRKFDQYRELHRYPNRSEAVRGLMRAALIEEVITNDESEAMGVVTLIYDHHASRISRRLTDLQHHHLDRVVTTTHVHLDERRCLEVILLARPGAARSATWPTT